MVGALLLAVGPGARAAPSTWWVRIDDPADLPPGAAPTERVRRGRSGAEWEVRVRDPAVLRGLPAVPSPPPRIPPGWPTPAEVESRIAAAVARAPRAGIVTLGWSHRGEPVTAVHLGLPPGDGPATRLLAGHHGDELPAVALALDVLDHLADADGVDPAVTAGLDATTVWIVPCVNPDGLADRSRESATGVDLNRNYGFGWTPGDWAGDAPFSEPETRAIRAFGDRVRPVTSLSLHAGAVNLGWPWNFTREDPPDAAVFEQVADAYAVGTGLDSFWITQGSEWYRTTGDTNDWAYGRWGVLDLTLEVSDDKAPDPSARERIRATHGPPLVAALLAPPDAVGRILDPDGHPLEARLSSADAAASWSDPLTGRWARRGRGPWTVEAWGYAPATTSGGDLALTALPVRDHPPIVVRGPTPVRLGGPATLVRAGEAPVPVADPDGRAVLDGDTLPPGAWTIAWPDGRTSPRAVLVEDRGDVGPAVARRAEDGVLLDGIAAAPGAAAAAVRGARLVPLPVRASDGGLAIAGAPPLLVWVGGAVLVVTDADLDPTPPLSTDEPLRVAGGCAAAPIRGNLGALALSVAGAAARRRRGGRGDRVAARGV